MKIDLHFHSDHSDGNEDLKTLAANYQQFGFKFLSLTDHNSIKSTFAFKDLFVGEEIKVIPGVELSTEHRGIHFHLMAYNFKAEAVDPLIKKIQKRRTEEIKKCLAELEKLGFEIDLKSLKKKFPASEYFGSYHLIHFLSDAENKEKLQKYNQGLDFWDLNSKLFEKGAPAYVKEEYMSAKEIIAVFKNAGAFISIAHPGQHFTFAEDYIIKDLAAMGISAIEAISFQHNWTMLVHYQSLAKELSLKITAGSDFHEAIESDLPAPDPREFFEVPDRMAEDLMKIL